MVHFLPNIMTTRQIEKNIKIKEELLGTPEVYKDGEATKMIKGEIAILEEELAIATKEWEKLG